MRVRGVKVVGVDEVAEGAPVGHVQEDVGLAEVGADGHVRVEIVAGGHEIGPGERNAGKVRGAPTSKKTPPQIPKVDFSKVCPKGPKC